MFLLATDVLCCRRVVSFSLMACAQIASSTKVNRHTQYTDPDGDFLWQSTSDFVPVQSQSFGNITIGHAMSMDFDFVWDGVPGAGMFFRVGADAESGGNGCYGNNHRYPALFLSDDNPPNLLLSLSEEEQCSKSYDLSIFGAISEGTSYRVQIAFNQTVLTVSIEQKGLIPRSKAWPRNGTPSAFIGEVVPVWWMSNKYGSGEYAVASGTFSSVTIKS